MGQILGSQQKWFSETNAAMGMVSFSTVLVMFSSNIWQLDRTPRTWIRWMAYFDALAYLIVYVGTSLNELMPECWKQNSYWLAADLVWSFKDAFKYGYISYKALSICGFKARWPCYATMIGSLLLYWLLCVQAYGFTAPDCHGTFKSQGPRVALYLYWTLVDVVASAMILHKMSSIVSNSKEVNTDNKVYYVIKFREEIRLLAVSVGMFAVTIVCIHHALNPEAEYLNIWSIVFVYCQVLLVMGSQKVVVGDGQAVGASGGSAASGGGNNAAAKSVGSRFGGSTKAGTSSHFKG
ncbi:hypothetical protein BDR26DRAFT_916453 [Obelidium mucronatum]|nr:hypothetical protein BDR26DRAFT_916453 [Obelidium mucronatum]